MSRDRPLYSLIIALHSPATTAPEPLEKQEDWRVGPLAIEWLDFHPDEKPEKGTMGEDNASQKNGPTFNSPTYRLPSPSDLATTQPLLAHFPLLSPNTTSGTTDLGPGVVHLFKHPPPAAKLAELDARGESKEEAGDEAEGGDGTLIAILAVPGWMRPSDFVDFIGGWTTCLEGIRMIRDVSPNKTLALLKFKAPQEASDFLSIFTGKTFSLAQPETCHPIRIHHLVLHTLSSPSELVPSSRASSPVSTRTKEKVTEGEQVVKAFPPSTYSSRNPPYLAALLKGIPPETTYELPNCIICLERMDSIITGLITAPCSHVFHCKCLYQWGDTRCPVCRLSHLLLSQFEQSSSSSPPSALSPDAHTTHCSMCDPADHQTQNNWMCLICGIVGCSRYEKGHARQHFLGTGHVFSMEIDTQRVWDYVEDNYVHRLIQNRSDGKLVELPPASSLVSHSHGTSGDPDDRGSGPSASDEKKISKIENITLEYSYLLTSQLEQQRKYFEGREEEMRRELEGLGEREGERVERGLKEAEVGRVKAEKKAEAATKLARRLQDDLSTEKTLSTALLTKVSALTTQVEASRAESQQLKSKVEDLEEMMRDLMANMEMGRAIKESGEGVGGDVAVGEGRSSRRKSGRK